MKVYYVNIKNKCIIKSASLQKQLKCKQIKKKILFERKYHIQTTIIQIDA